MLYQVEDVFVVFEIAHAADFSDEMRRFRERHRVQAAADAIAGLEQAYAQMRLLLAQPPGCVDARYAAADDGDVEVGRGRRAGEQRYCRKRGRGTAEEMAPADLHCGGVVRTARRA